VGFPYIAAKTEFVGLGRRETEMRSSAERIGSGGGGFGVLTVVRGEGYCGGIVFGGYPLED